MWCGDENINCGIDDGDDSNGDKGGGCGGDRENIVKLF